MRRRVNPEQLASRKEHSPAELEIRIAEWKNERIAAKRRTKTMCLCTAIAYIVRSLRRNVAASRLPIAPFLAIRICFGFRASNFRFPAPPGCGLCAA